MFRLATVPALALRSCRSPLAHSRAAAVPAERTRRAASADLRIRRFESGSVNEESYTAVVPSDGAAPVDLLRIITEACKDLPEFQIQGEADEQFIMTLTLKG
jgi:hypothetical protein